MLPAGALLYVCTPLDIRHSQKTASVATRTLWSCSGLSTCWDQAQPIPHPKNLLLKENRHLYYIFEE